MKKRINCGVTVSDTTGRHRRELSTEAFGHDKRKLCCIRPTDNQADWHTQRLIPDPKTSSPLWPPIESHCLHPPSSSLHPSQPSSSLAPVTGPKPGFLLFSQTHTHRHTWRHIRPLKATTRPQSALPSQSQCWRNQAKGVIDETDRIQGCGEGEVRLRSSLLSHATYATPLMTSPWPETFKLWRWLSVISSVWGWKIPEDFQLQSTEFFGYWKVWERE